METVNRIIEGYKEDFTEQLKRWINVPSVKADPDGDAPFGAEVKRMLALALNDATELGFETRNFANYAGDIRMGKIGVEPLGILAHLDVVPVGDGWRVDPFEGVVEDGRMLGRGTSDDKGPALAALYAMRAIKEAGIPLKREVRLILGCDEESGWADIDYYKAHCDMPKTGFSPDASYPVYNTEKGGINLSLRAPKATDGLNVKFIDVGTRCNVIPGIASAVVEGDAALCERIKGLSKEMTLNIAAECVEGGVKLTATGVQGHAAHPEAAHNAIGELLLMLRALGVTGALKTLADRVGVEYDGLSLGVKCSDETSGGLTNNLGILRYGDDGLYATLDIRYPLLAHSEPIIREIREALGKGIEVTVDSTRTPHHVSPYSALITALLDAYHEETGRARECVATGGGTYARCLDEGVAFGAAFPEDEDMAHQANEYVNLDGMMQNIRIIARAIVKLAGENA